MSRGPTVVALLIFSASLFAQQATPDPLLRWVDRIAQRELDERDKAIAAIHTIPEAEHRKQWVRAKLLEILGGLPEYNVPLNARVLGKLENDSYTVEKVIFESLPGYYVTANVYRPNNPGAIPRFCCRPVTPRPASSASSRCPNNRRGRRPRRAGQADNP